MKCQDKWVIEDPEGDVKENERGGDIWRMNNGELVMLS